jgi:hypothetical protein
MSEAPKKIWIETFFAKRFFTSQEIRTHGTTEYIRADIVEEMREALLLALCTLNTDDPLSIKAFEACDAAYKRLEQE